MFYKQRSAEAGVSTPIAKLGGYIQPHWCPTYDIRTFCLLFRVFNFMCIFFSVFMDIFILVFCTDNHKF